MDKSFLIATVAMTGAAGLSLWKGVGALRSMLKDREIAVLTPAGGAVDLRKAGDVVLSIRGTLGTRDFADASFALRDAQGKPAPSRMILMRTQQTNLSGETTLSIRRFAIAAPGRYLLEAGGIDASSVSANSRLVLSAPGGTALLLGILWIVVSAVILIGGVAMSAVIGFN